MNIPEHVILDQTVFCSLGAAGLDFVSAPPLAIKLWGHGSGIHGSWLILFAVHLKYNGCQAKHMSRVKSLCTVGIHNCIVIANHIRFELDKERLVSSHD